MADISQPEGAFPLQALVPKRETGAANFLTKYPKYDGRGVIVAVFDTGVDPGAPGLQVTSTGERKVIDCIDASGSGDVDTSHTVTTAATPCDTDIEIQGLARRTLKLNNQWKNPTGVWHVGTKLLEQLFPTSVNTRVKSREEDTKFKPVHQRVVAQALLDLDKWSTAHPSPSQKEKDQQEELQARVDILSSLTKKLSMPSSNADVIAFHDGDEWRVAIGLEADGDMTAVEPLLPFRISGEYSTFGGDAQVNYTVDVFDDGATVSIVIASGAHGTHVAGITAACFPDEPDRNGVAPGAQILSVKIGDTRLSTMETGTSFVRGAIAAIKYKCDLVNLSYGEAAEFDNAGHSVKVLTDLAKKHGITFVASAGNNGPCLSTVGCPGGTSTGMISVGAYVSPEMMEAQYGMLEKTSGQNYTWSSAGPSTDGSLGVDISAPGGAITSVPTWTLKSNQLMNGTSMSSPNACGCIALILSGLKDTGVAYSPSSVRRAVINSASCQRSVERFVHGHGLIQVEPAFDWLCRYRDAMEKNLWFEVVASVPRRPNQRGIYLRDGCESLSQPVRAQVSVTPRYPREHEDYNESQLSLDLRLTLVATENWVQVCSHLALANYCRSFQVSVDTRGLEPGSHYAEVQAFDSTDVSRGPLFRVPVSVLVPHTFEPGESPVYKDTMVFKSGAPQRRFIRVPAAATYCDIVISNSSKAGARYSLHGIQLEPSSRYSTHELYKGLTFSSGDEVREFQFAVLGGAMLELTCAKWWAVCATGELSISLHFHSLQLVSPVSCLHSNDGFEKLLVRNGLDTCHLQPQCSATHVVSVYTPSERKTILPLGERDREPDHLGAVYYELQLTYKFTISGSGGKSYEVSPQFRLLSTMLYESDYHAQLWMLYDANKRYIKSGDAFAERYSCKLERGEYTLRLQIRHHSAQRLEVLKDLPLSLLIKLPSAVNLDVYESQLSLLQSRNKFSPRIIAPGVTVPLFLACPNMEKLPGMVKPNSILTGHLSLSKPWSPVGTKAAEAVDRQPFTIGVHHLTGSSSKSSSSPPTTASSTANATTTAAAAAAASTTATSQSSSSSESTQESAESDGAASDKAAEKYQEALRDFNISWMAKSGDVTQYAELARAYPDHLPLFTAYLTGVCSAMEKEGFSGAKAVITTANKIISMVDVKEMAGVCYRKKDTRCNAAAIKSVMEKQRTALQDALIKKGTALCSLNSGAVAQAPSGDPPSPTAGEFLAQLADDDDASSSLPCSEEEVKEQLDEVMSQLETWFDIWDAKVLPLTTQYFAQKQWPAKAIKAMLKTMELASSPSSKDEQATTQLCKFLDVLEYGHLSSVYRRSLPTRFPSAYLPF